MASETTPEAIPTQQKDPVVEESLPFSGLDQSGFVPLLSGPRISSIKEDPKKYYGPVTIRSSSFIIFMFSIANYIFRELSNRSHEKDFASL